MANQSDIALVGVAAHKAARILAKDRIAEPLRALRSPDSYAGYALRCPYCLAVWACALGHLGLRLAPRTTRAALAVLASVSVSDLCQVVAGRRA